MTAPHKLAIRGRVSGGESERCPRLRQQGKSPTTSYGLLQRACALARAWSLLDPRERGGGLAHLADERQGVGRAESRHVLARVRSNAQRVQPRHDEPLGSGEQAEDA